MKRTPEVISTYTDATGNLVKVYAEKKAKHPKWQKNDTFYGAKMRIEEDSCFATFSRKAGKA